MLGQMLSGWPEIALYRWNDPPAGEHREQAGKVGIDADAAGGDDGVVVGDAEHPLVEAPVAGTAEGHAVADVVVLRFAPGHDVGRLHHRVAVGGDDTDAAQGAAVVVGRGHHLAEGLVAHVGAVVVRLHDLLHQRQVGLLLQYPAVVEGLPIDDRLLPQQHRRLLRETGKEQRFPQRLPPFPALDDPKQPVVQLGAQGIFAQVADGGGVVDHRIGDGFARLGDQLPERFAGEAGEGKGDAAGLAQRHDPPPVEVEQLVQLHQIAADGDEGGSDDAAVHQVQHRQEQQRLVRRLAPGGLGPDRAGGAGEGREEFEGGGERGHGYDFLDI